MGWARVAPSRYLLLCIFLTTTVTVCVCVASCVVLWLAPQVPYAQTYSGGAYIHYPALLLAATALLSGLSLFLGACGQSRDSKAALIVYCVMVLAVAGGELVGSGTVFSFAYIGELETAMGHRLWSDVKSFLNEDNSSITYRINNLQHKYSCCGVNGYKDWNNTRWSEKEGEGQLAPESCCKPQFSSGNFNCTFNSSMLFHTGCVDVLLYRMDVAIDCVLGVCVVAALLNLVTAVLACHGARVIRRYQNYSVL